MRTSFPKRLIYLFAASLIIVTACGTPYQPEEDPEEEQEEQEEQIELTQNDPVPSDGVLETVTWNIELYGDGSYGSDNEENWGPENEQQQIKNILQVTDSLKADLYAFQEIYSQQALDDITENMSGYSGFVADHVNWKQKMAFVYNTNSIDSVSAGAITEGQSDHDWAGRFPLYFQFSYKNSDKEFYAVTIHAKANTGQNSAEYEESYNRRVNAAQDLYDYLMANKPDANIIFLGDYNDDVDKSIYYEEQNGEQVYQDTPYQPFVANDDHFKVVTETLSDAGKSSYVGEDDIVDHITMSNELDPIYVDESAMVFQFDDSFIEDYGTSTSDHYPVWAKFDVNTTKKVLKEN